jgi:hypothetical protein
MSDYEVGILWALSWDKPDVQVLVKKLVKERADYWAGWYRPAASAEYERAVAEFNLPKEFVL